MPFKRPGRPHWYVWRTLPGLGRPGPWSTGTKDRRLAQRIEDFLVDTALTDPALVRGIIENRYTLREMWVARLEGRLERLKELAVDPPLSEVVERFRPHVANRRINDGLNHLMARVPDGARLSWLLDAKNITNVCAKMVADGYKPNGVHRSLYRAIADLLAYEVGKQRRQAILIDVVKPGEDDTRNVELAPAEIRLILSEADDEMRPIIEAAVLTGIDRGPLVRMRVRDFNEAERSVLARDTKAKSRWRRVPLSEAAMALLRRQTAGRGLDEPMFPGLSDAAVGGRWKYIRERAKRPDLRFKDLRHVFAANFVRAGGTIADLSEILGHTNRSTTLKYTATQVRAQRDTMDRVAESLGLDQRLEVEDDETLAAAGGG